MKKFDAVVVGAGPAGTSVARQLAHWGASVALLEKANFPRYKVCGGGIVGRAARMLPFEMDALAEQRCDRIDICFRGIRKTIRYEDGTSIIAMTMRSVLDEALLDAAVAEGALLFSPCEAITAELVEGGIMITTNRGLFFGKLVYACEGANSRLRSWAGFPNSYRVPALEAEVVVGSGLFSQYGGSGRFDFDLPPNGYAWVFPKRDHLSIGVISMKRGRSELRKDLAEYLRGLGITPKSISIRGSVVPIAPRTRSFVRKRVVLVGDAAGLADPLTAEGISAALKSGHLAADAGLAGNFVEEVTRGLYDRVLDGEVLSPQSPGRLASNLFFSSATLRRHVARSLSGTGIRKLSAVFQGQNSYSAVLRSSFRPFIRSLIP